MTESPFLSVGEVARLTGVHRNTVRRMVARGDLPGAQFGRTYRIAHSAVEVLQTMTAARRDDRALFREAESKRHEQMEEEYERRRAEGVAWEVARKERRLNPPVLATVFIAPPATTLPNGREMAESAMDRYLCGERQTFIYFIKAVDLDLVKIGMSDNVYGRLRVLAAMSPVPLEVRGFFPGDQRVETCLHMAFHDYRSHGEWFQWVPEIREFISEHTLKPEDWTVFYGR